MIGILTLKTREAVRSREGGIEHFLLSSVVGT